jgi:hemin uptake protein HemP
MPVLPQATAKPEAGGAERPAFSTEDLFGSATEIDIAHHGLTYRLKITRQGRLVLNK